MPKIYKLSMGGLKKIIAAEQVALSEAGGFGPVGDVTKEPKKTKEVEADEYASTLEKEIDHLKAAKIRETKLLLKLKRLREQMRASHKRIEESKRGLAEARSKKRAAKNG